MRRLFVAAVTAALVAGGAPIASAHPDFHYEGGCQMVAVKDPSSQADLWVGVLTGAVVATRNNGLPAPLAPIDVQCVLYVNGALAGVTGTGGLGTGVATIWNAVAFVAARTDVVDVCEWVSVNGEGHETCDSSEFVQTVPQPIIDLAQSVLDLVEPVLCLALGTLSPGLPPTLVVGPDGDVTLAGIQVYDCPPYGTGNPNVQRLVPTVLVNR